MKTDIKVKYFCIHWPSGKFKHVDRDAAEKLAKRSDTCVTKTTTIKEYLN